MNFNSTEFSIHKCEEQKNLIEKSAQNVNSYQSGPGQLGNGPFEKNTQF